MKHNRIRFNCFLLLFLLVYLPLSRVQGQAVYCSGEHIVDTFYNVPGIPVPVPVDTVLYNNSGQTQTLSIDFFGLPMFHRDYIVHPSYLTDNPVNTCDSYTWQVSTITRTYMDSQRDTIVLPTVHGCDSVWALDLTIRHSTATTYTATACDSYIWTDGNGLTYTTSNNTDTYILTNAVGCDSTVTLNLTVDYGTHTPTTATACRNYRWQSQYYDQTFTCTSPLDTNEQVYTQNYTNAVNCPSTDTLHLRLYVNDTVTEGPFVQCDSMMWRGVMRRATMNYEEVVSHVVGGVCDSVYQMHLDIHTSHTDTLATPVENLGQRCGAFTWHGNTYQPAADTAQAYATIQTVHGCDSLVAMRVMVYPSGAFIEPYVLRGCGSYTYQPVGRPPVVFYHDSLYTRDTLLIPTVHGCDSVVQIQVRVFPTYDTTIQVTVCGEYTWANVANLGLNGERVSDSVYRADATLGPVTFQTYPVDEEVCDSIVTLLLTVLPNDTVSDTVSSCYPIHYGDSTYNVSTVVYDTLSGTAANGCFRIGEHHIIIHDTAERYYTVNACYYYDWLTVRHFSTTDTVGYFATQYGCDSTVHLHIVIHDSTLSNEVNTVCGDTTWNGLFLPEVVGSVVVYDTTAYHIPNYWGCDSSVHITLTVKPNSYGHISETVCDQFLWNNLVVTSDTTISYRSPGLAANGCDTVTYVHLTVRNSTASQIDTTVCDRFDFYTGLPARNSNPPTFYHGSFQSDITYPVVLTNAAGCDSIVTLNLVVKQSSTGEETLTACDSLLWNGVWYHNSGNHVQTLTNTVGCDSVTTLHLTLHNSAITQDVVNACDSYIWSLNGTTYNHSTGNVHPTVTLHDIYGCDSLVELHLTVNYSDLNAGVIVSACDRYVWHGNTYNNTTTATFDTLTSAGCDSTVTLNLNIRRSVMASISPIVCDSVLWHTGVWYTESTVFDDTLRAVAGNGCDSINRVQLTVLRPVYTHLYDTACDSYTWQHNGVTYTMTGDIVDTVPSSMGCDSVVTLHLTIYHSDTVQSIYNTDTRLACESYDWNGQTYTQSGLYQIDIVDVHGCAQRQWLDLIVGTVGNDTVYRVGCDSVSYDGVQYFYTDRLYIVDSTVTATCNIYHWVDLKVDHPVSTTQTVVTCDRYEWTDGVNYRYDFLDDTVLSIALPRSVGACDSTVTLNLTVNHPSTGYDYVSACDSYYGTPLQRYFTSSFDSIINLTSLNGTVNQYGCDSLLHQVVNIRHSSTARVDTTVCQGMVWNGVYYTASIYGPLLPYQNSEGCRHMDTLNLTVYHPDTAAAELHVACDSMRWYNNLYTLSGTYYHHVDSVSNGVCDSVYVLQLTVYPTLTDTLTDGNCYNYTWTRNGQSYYASGLYSVTQTGAAVGGCDSVYWLNLSIYQNETEDVFDIVCDSAEWNGTTYSQTGLYPYYTQSSHGCDSVALLHLTVNHSDTTSSHIYQTVCGNYVWKGVTYFTSGLYRFDTLTVSGCDSTVWLHLTVNSFDTIDTMVVNTTNTNYCDSYTWNIEGRSHHYTLSGIYFDTVSSGVSICGQLHRLELTIPQSSSDTVVSAHCGNWTYNGVNYYADTLIERGRDRGGNRSGCDSIHYLQIFIHHPVTVVDTQNVCDSLVWLDGNTYTADNSTASYLVPGGSSLTHCDSTVMLHLTVRHTTMHQDTLVGCDSRYWHLVGRTYYADLDTLVNYTTLTGTQNAVGCDSLIAMHLSVPSSSHTVDSVINCGPYRWSDGVLYSNSIDGPTYLDRNQYGCDSTVTLHLEVYMSVNAYEVDTVCDSTVWHGATYAVSGFYMDPHIGVIHGVCDSVYYYDLVLYNTHYAPVERVASRLFYQWPRTGQWCRTSGVYTYTAPNAVNGHCDSVYTLQLSLYGDSVSNVSQVACKQYTWRGHTYSATGVYRDTVHNAVHGVADSIYVLNLTVFNPDTLTQTVMACNEYIWTPDTLTASNTYYHYDHNAIGGVCDRVHKLNLTIQQLYVDSVAVTVCGSFNWRNHRYTQSGDYQDVIPRDAVTACDSVFKLHLIVNSEYHVTNNQTACDAFYWAPSNRTFVTDTSLVENLYTSLNCDSIVTINLHIEHSSDRVSHRTVEACERYTWPLTGRTYTASTTDTYSISDGHTCDSTVTMHLTVYPVNTTVTRRSGCDSYTWRGNTYTASGSYFDTVLSSHGCDSILNMQLSIYHPNHSGVETVTACDSYTWHGQTYTASTTTATFDTLTRRGCDSTVTLHLTINRSRSVVSTRDRCDSYTWHGVTYTQSTNTPTYHTQTSKGCDSTITLHLTIRHSTTGILDTAACTSLSWVDGHIYTASTTTPTYTYVGGNSEGCDSTVTLHLTIYPVKTTVTRRSGCDSYTWRGNTYTASGSYYDTVSTVHGCDSILNMQLTIYHPDHSGVETVTACDSYTWHGQTYTVSTTTATFDTLTRRSCDSTVTLHLTINHSVHNHEYVNSCGPYTWAVNGRTYNQSGLKTYRDTTAEGCAVRDSLTLSVFPTYTTSINETACDSYTWYGKTYTASGAYCDTVPTIHGCDSILNMQLTLYHSDRSGVDTATSCDSYTWHGQTYTASTTTATFDTLTLHGCDSTVTLHLTINRSRSVVSTRDRCDRYTWHGVTYTESTNTPTYHTQTSRGCDSTITLHLTIRHSTTAVFDTAVCASLTWIDGQTYSEPTTTPTYTIAGGNAEGCDSTVMLHLTINNNGSTVDYDACDSIDWNGVVYHASTSITDHFTNASGCDSVVTYRLHVHSSVSTTETATACDSLVWHGVTYTHSVNDAVWQEQTAMGCDSTVVLHLTLNQSNSAVVDETACDSYRWHGTTYTRNTELGDASYVTTNAAGCDSTTWLLLTLHHSAATSFNDKGVGVYTWNGVDYTASGTYTQTLTTVDGCDSVVTLHLVMIDFAVPQILVHDERLLMVNHYPDGNRRVDYIAYRWYRNNTLIPSATNDYYSLPNYQALSGCYYVEVPVDASRSMWVPSNTICIGQGIDEVDGVDFTLYPNPVVSGTQLTVHATVPSATLTLYDLQGRQLLSRRMEGDVLTIDTDYPAGVYTVRLETDEGSSVAKKLIIR